MRGGNRASNGSYYTLNVRSQGKQLVLFFREAWCSSRETSGPEGKQNQLVPEGPDVKCFVIFLDFHFNSINKRITGANQNSRLGTHNNTNLILKTTEWMIYKVVSLYYLHLFPPLAVFLLSEEFKNRRFLDWGFVFVFKLLCSFTCCNVARAGYIV